MLLAERGVVGSEQKDGKLVAAGFSFNGSNNDFALVRYNPDGTPAASARGPRTSRTAGCGT